MEFQGEMELCMVLLTCVLLYIVIYPFNIGGLINRNDQGTDLTPLVICLSEGILITSFLKIKPYKLSVDKKVGEEQESIK